MIAVVFPGQGSQKPGMGKELAENFSSAAAVYDEVSEVLGLDLRDLSWNTPEEELRKTEIAQICLFTASFAAYRVFVEEVRADVVALAGHSVGEFAALAAAGVYTPEDAARLVEARGRTMAQAGQESPGAMAAVLGLGREELRAICTVTPGLVAVANDNSPGQIVISGEQAAVTLAGAAATAAGAKRVVMLNVSGAFHSPLMEKASLAMRAEFDRYPTSIPTKKIYSNVTSEPELEGWPQLLERQLISPVRWTETVNHLARDGVRVVVECGVGDVLSGLVRRIDPELRSYKVSDVASLRATMEALGEN